MKLKVVATIEARMGSTRLPGKVLAPIMGRPILSFLLERIKRAKTVDEIVVATTTKIADDKIAAVAKKDGVQVFRGSEEDVLKRVVQAAQKFRADVVVRLTADCPLVDPEQIDHGVRFLIDGGYDYVANNNLTLMIPRGFDVEVVRADKLTEAVKIKDKKIHEHPTLLFFENFKKYRTKAFGPPAKLRRPKWRLTVDTERDLELIRRVFRLVYVKKPEFGYLDVVQLLEKYPRLLKINQGIEHKGGRPSERLAKTIQEKSAVGFYGYRPKFRAAIAGCGRVASGYDCDPKFVKVSSHAGAYQTHPEIQLAAACDVDSGARQRFLDRWGEVNMYESVEEMLGKEKIDILSVTTKPDQHYPVLAAAINAGVGAIFCEKPFTDDPKKAKKIVDLCQQKKIILMVDYNRRFDAGHQKLKAESQKLGRCLGGIMTYSNGWINNGSHAVDLVRWLGGEITEVLTVVETAGKFEPDYTVTARLKDNGRVLFLPIPVGDYYQFGLQLWFQKGKIAIEDQGEILKLLLADKHPLIATINKLSTTPEKSIIGSYQTLPEAVENLVGVLSGREKPMSTGESALATRRVLALAVRSWQARKTFEL